MTTTTSLTSISDLTVTKKDQSELHLFYIPDQTYNEQKCKNHTMCDLVCVHILSAKIFDLLRENHDKPECAVSLHCEPSSDMLLGRRQPSAPVSFAPVSGVICVDFCEICSKSAQYKYYKLQKLFKLFRIYHCSLHKNQVTAHTSTNACSLPTSRHRKMH